MGWVGATFKPKVHSVLIYPVVNRNDGGSAVGVDTDICPSVKIEKIGQISVKKTK